MENASLLYVNDLTLNSTCDILPQSMISDHSGFYNLGYGAGRIWVGFLLCLQRKDNEDDHGD